MKTSSISYLFLGFFVFFIVGGCASSRRSFGTEAELAAATVYARYEIPLKGETFCPSDVSLVMRDALQAVGDSAEERTWSPEALSKVGRYLRLCKWALGNHGRGESLQVAIINGPKSFHKDGVVYLTVENNAMYRTTVLVHEFGGHACSNEQETEGFSLLNPTSWFGSPSRVLAEEIQAEVAVALFFRRLHAYSGWNPVPELRFFPLDEPGEPELWPFFVKGGEVDPEARAFVEKLHGVRSFQELEAFCATQEKPEWALVWICCTLLEAHHRDLEVVWTFLHTCDDGVLEQHINQILQLMPADLAVKAFVKQRKALFR